MFQFLAVEHGDGMSEIRLNRPGRLNAVHLELLNELEAAFAEAVRESEAIVLGATGRSFCAGADLAALRRYVEEPAVLREFLETWERVCFGIERCPRPVVAAVQGFAVAGGLELLLCCDVIFAARSAEFGDLHVQNGLIPGGGGTVRLPRAIGLPRAMYMLLKPQTMSAEAARAIGLVSEVVEDGSLASAAREFARTLTGPRAVAAAVLKKLARGAVEVDIGRGLADERDYLLKRLDDPIVRQSLDAYRKETQTTTASAPEGKQP